MASKKEIDEHFKVALEEIGKITPWFDKEVNAWVFEHKNYPAIVYAADTPKEVIQKYPLAIRVFIKERLEGNLNPITEKETKGRGGKRVGAGRPRGTKKEPTTQIRVPLDIAEWLKYPGQFDNIRQMARAYHN